MWNTLIYRMNLREEWLRIASTHVWNGVVVAPVREPNCRMNTAGRLPSCQTKLIWMEYLPTKSRTNEGY